jgi:hypothetical protein
METIVSNTPKTPAPTSPATSKTVLVPPGTPDPKTITLPLSPALQAAYHDLYNQYEATIETTTDPGVLEALNASQLDVGNVLIKNSEYQIAKNTALYNALLTQINGTNTDLKALQKQIMAIAGKVQTFGTILAAINKVLGLVGV